MRARWSAAAGKRLRRRPVLHDGRRLYERRLHRAAAQLRRHRMPAPRTSATMPSTSVSTRRSARAAHATTDSSARSMRPARLGSAAGAQRATVPTPALCTVDACDDAADQCVHDPGAARGHCRATMPMPAPSGDHCAGGACAATPLDCSDGQPCTVDTCSSVSGCAHSEGPATGCLRPERSVFVIRNSVDDQEEQAGVAVDPRTGGCHQLRRSDADDRVRALRLRPIERWQRVAPGDVRGRVPGQRVAEARRRRRRSPSDASSAMTPVSSRWCSSPWRAARDG